MLLKKLSLRFASIRLKEKLLLSYLFIILTIVLVITLVMSWLYLHNDLQDQKAKTSTIAQLVAGKIDNQIREYEDRIFTASININSGTAAAAESDYALQYEHEAQVTSELDIMLNTMNSIDGVMLRDISGATYTANKSAANSVEEMQAVMGQSSVSADPQISKGTWTSRKGHIYYKRDLFITAPMVQYIGTIVLAISSDYLSSNHLDDDTLGGWYAVFTGDGSYLMGCGDGLPVGKFTGTSSKLLGSTRRGQIMTFSRTRYLISSAASDDGNWSILYAVPLATFSSKWTFLRLSIYALAFALLVIMAVFAYCLSDGFTKSVSCVIAGINRIKSGHFDTPIPVASKDEIGIVADSINEMAGKIKELIANLVNEKLKRERLQYQMLSIKYSTLQAQIHPHFMYNALDTISSLAKLAGEQDVSNLIVCFSRLLRRNIEICNKFIPLRDELEYIRDFLTVYKSIYTGRLHSNIYVEEELDGYMVPGLILQPIVENAIVHNINSTEELYVSVRVYREGNSLIMEVEDNGGGFDENGYRQILSEIESDDPAEPNNGDGKIGMVNVIRRLRLLYKENASLTVHSSPGKGSLIVIRMQNIVGPGHTDTTSA